MSALFAIIGLCIFPGFLFVGAVVLSWRERCRRLSPAREAEVLDFRDWLDDWDEWSDD